MDNKVVFGLAGFKGMTPVWAAKASNYILIATVLLFVLKGMIMDWAELIPADVSAQVEAVLNALEKTMVTISTGLRFLGVTKSEPINENIYGVPHDNG